MFKLTCCTQEDLQKTIQLINKTFRNSQPMMEKEFPMLLSEDNLERMIMVKEDDDIASITNYYKSKVFIEGTPIQVGSIGAVCTDEAYRGKGYSSKILDEVELRMLREGIRLQLISGGRSLYTRRGATTGGKVYSFSIESERSDEVKLEQVTVEDANELLKFYNTSSTRYYRNIEEFITLIDVGKFTYDDFMKVFIDEEWVGYFLISKAQNRVVEFAGNINHLIKAIKHYLALNNIGSINLSTGVSTLEASYLKHNGYTYEKKSIQGTIKILNLKGFWEDLKPYLRQYISDEEINKIIISERDHTFINYEDEELILEEHSDLIHLLFGTWEEGNLLNSCPKFKKIADKIFPLPFPQTDNLNYI